MYRSGMDLGMVPKIHTIHKASLPSPIKFKDELAFMSKIRCC